MRFPCLSTKQASQGHGSDALSKVGHGGDVRTVRDLKIRKKSSGGGDVAGRNPRFEKIKGLASCPLYRLDFS